METPFEKPVFITSPLIPDLEKVNQRLSRIWESKQLTNNGSQHKELNLKLKEYLETDYLSLFNNGTMALLLGLKALNLTGEVITTPFTFPATVQALDWNNLTPVFCDVNPITLNIDADKIEGMITEYTSAILAVHVFGNPCETEKIQEIAGKYKLKVIYDGAHAFGMKVNGRSISSFGDMTMFSFHATKLFNTVEGGALAFSDARLAGKLELLKNFGLLNGEEVLLSGLNAKLNEVQAGIGMEVLELVEGERKKRHELQKAYRHHLEGIPGIRIITDLEGEFSSYQYFVIEIDENKFGQSRDFVHEELKKYNVFTRRYFYPLCSDFEWYKKLDSAQAENLPIAQQAVRQVLAMPYYGGLESESVSVICRMIREIQLRQMALNQL